MKDGPLGNVRLAACSWDSADLSSLIIGLELALEPPICLFFPAGGVIPAAGNGPENEAVHTNADAVPPEQPAAPDLATILVTCSAKECHRLSVR